MKRIEGLSELRKKVDEFIKHNGKTSREEVMKNIRLNEAEMDAQLNQLIHAELINEKGEKGNLCLLVAIN